MNVNVAKLSSGYDKVWARRHRSASGHLVPTWAKAPNSETMFSLARRSSGSLALASCFPMTREQLCENVVSDQRADIVASSRSGHDSFLFLFLKTYVYPFLGLVTIQ